MYSSDVTEQNLVQTCEAQLDRVRTYLFNDFTEGNLDASVTRHLRNSEASVLEALAIIRGNDVLDTIRQVVNERTQLETQYGGFKLDLTLSQINVSKLLIGIQRGQRLVYLNIPRYSGPMDVIKAHLVLSKALTTLSENRYTILGHDGMMAARESITVSEILVDAIEAVNLSPRATESRSIALNVISKCYLDDGDLRTAIEMASGAVESARCRPCEEDEEDEDSRSITHQPSVLAISLITLSRCQLALRHTGKMFAAISEAITLLRDHSKETPEIETYLAAALELRAISHDDSPEARRDQKEASALRVTHLKARLHDRAHEYADFAYILEYFGFNQSASHPPEALRILHRQAKLMEEIRFKLNSAQYDSQGSRITFPKTRSPLITFSDWLASMGQYDAVTEFANGALRLYEHEPTSRLMYQGDIAFIYRHLSDYHTCLHNYHKAKICIEKSVDNYDKQLFGSERVSSLQRLSELRYQEGQQQNSLQCTSDAIDLCNDLCTGEKPPDANTLQLLSSRLARHLAMSRGDLMGDDIRMVTKMLKVFRTVAKRFPSIYAVQCCRSSTQLLGSLGLIVGTTHIKALHQLEDTIHYLTHLSRMATRRDHIGHVIYLSCLRFLKARTISWYSISFSHGDRVPTTIRSTRNLRRRRRLVCFLLVRSQRVYLMLLAADGARAILMQSGFLDVLCKKIPVKGQLIWPILLKLAIHGEPYCCSFLFKFSYQDYSYQD